MILRLSVHTADLLHDHVRSTVPHLSAGDMSVLNSDNGMFGVFGTHIMDHNFTAAAERSGDSLGNLLQFVQNCGFDSLSPPSQSVSLDFG